MNKRQKIKALKAEIEIWKRRCAALKAISFGAMCSSVGRIQSDAGPDLGKRLASHRLPSESILTGVDFGALEQVVMSRFEVREGGPELRDILFGSRDSNKVVGRVTNVEVPNGVRSPAETGDV
jgi:hypothetical protein